MEELFDRAQASSSERLPAISEEMRLGSSFHVIGSTSIALLTCRRSWPKIEIDGTVRIGEQPVVGRFGRNGGVG